MLRIGLSLYVAVFAVLLGALSVLSFVNAASSSSAAISVMFGIIIGAVAVVFGWIAFRLSQRG